MAFMMCIPNDFKGQKAFPVSVHNHPRRMRWAGHVARMGEKRNVYRLLVRNPEGKKPLGR
jgi:hypothetical protein